MTIPHCSTIFATVTSIQGSAVAPIDETAFQERRAGLNLICYGDSFNHPDHRGSYRIMAGEPLPAF